MDIKSTLKNYLKTVMNKNKKISILLPIILIVSNSLSFGMFNNLTKTLSKKKTHIITISQKIAIGTGLLTAGTTVVKITPPLTDLYKNQPKPENNPFYSKYSPLKWYLGSKHKKDMEELGEKNASPEIQLLFHKALCNSSWQCRWGIRNPDNVPIKIKKDDQYLKLVE